MNNITKEDIANFINSEFGLTRKDCNNFVKDIIEEIRSNYSGKVIVGEDLSVY